MSLCLGIGIAQLLLSPQGLMNKRMALDGKLGAHTLILPLAVWAAEPAPLTLMGNS